MKKLALIVLALVMALSLVACSVAAVDGASAGTPTVVEEPVDE